MNLLPLHLTMNWLYRFMWDAQLITRMLMLVLTIVHQVHLTPGFLALIHPFKAHSYNSLLMLRATATCSSILPLYCLFVNPHCTLGQIPLYFLCWEPALRVPSPLPLGHRILSFSATPLVVRTWPLSLIHKLHHLR